MLDRRRTNSTLRNLTVNENQVDFSSNDFLSLSTSCTLKEAYLKELSSADLSLGSGGSRLLDGNSAYAENLEKEIAGFHKADSGLLFNSGFDANAGFFACVPQKGDVVVYDELIHASVHDGMRLSRATKRVPFRHNCVADLKRILKGLVCGEDDSSARLQDGTAHVFVAVEAIYSMDGDLAPLHAIVETVEATLPRGSGYIVVDEAHATGVVGPRGQGLVCELGLEGRVFARLHTFGKALACNGGETSSSLLRKGSRMTLDSNHTRFTYPSPLSHQLRSPPNIHNLHVLPCASRYPYLVLFPPTGSLRSPSSDTPLSHPDAVYRTKPCEEPCIQTALKNSPRMSSVGHLSGPIG